MCKTDPCNDTLPFKDATGTPKPEFNSLIIQMKKDLEEVPKTDLERTFFPSPVVSVKIQLP